MDWLSKLERRFGRFAIKNLMLYVVILYGIGLIINLTRPQFYYDYLALVVPQVLKGQVWRLFTFLIYPPTGNIFFAVIMGYVYYSIGNTLEHMWGSFKFNVYFISGVLFHILGLFIVYFLWENTIFVTTDYLNLSLFLAFAATFPDAQFLLFYLIPVKAKILGLIDAAVFAFSFVMALINHDWSMAVIIVMSFLNFLVFFFTTKRFSFASPGVMKQRVKFKSAMNSSQHRAGQAYHKCAICGQTELDNPALEFRYCSKCAGGREYCMEHLYTHVHIKEDM
ncbi:MAG: hypothetical protein IJM37_08080 [Lachnospiraceae bacterium]|nr:hypothetical protein [Lachnospiraceae bacterium]